MLVFELVGRIDAQVWIFYIGAQEHMFEHAVCIETHA